MKKAILAVSFGTSHADTLEKTIGAIEADLAAAFPDRQLFRAFTSGMIVKKLNRRDGLAIRTVSQALEALAGEGYEDVVLQSTHVINGEEWDKLRAQAAPFAGQFHRLSFGMPLLTGIEDYRAVTEALLSRLPGPEPGTAIVFMGHGSEHPANAVYAILEYMFHDLGRRDIRVGTVEGYPGFEEVSRRLQEAGDVKRVRCYPLMVVAGDHAKNDLAGEEPDSWRSRLEAQGYEVRCILEGLGEIPEIRAIFVDHAQGAVEEENHG